MLKLNYTVLSWLNYYTYYTAKMNPPPKRTTKTAEYITVKIGQGSFFNVNRRLVSKSGGAAT